MSDPQSPSSAPTPPNVATLVEAIETRARQAGREASTEVMQRMLGSVSDVLQAISNRLDHVEDLLERGGPSDAGGAAGPSALVDAVQAGLSSFNARLGRLEEAFVQAVDDSGSGSQAVVDEVRTAVAQALEEVGTAATEAPALDHDTRDALARVESALASLAEGASSTSAKPVEDALQLALSAFGERLDALEQRVVATVQDQPRPEPPPPPPPVDLGEQLIPVLGRLDDLERRLMAWANESSGTTVDEAFELVQVRIAGLEQLVRTRASERPDPAAEVRAAIAPALEQLQVVETGLRSNRDHITRVDAALAALPGRFVSLEERVWAVVQSLADGDGGAGLDPAVLTRLEEAVDRLDRDEATARLVRLIEERMSAGLRAVTERTDEVRRSLEKFVAAAASTATASSAGAEDVKSRVDALTSEVRALSTMPDVVSTALAGRLSPLADRVGGLDARLDSLDARVAGIDETVGALHASLDSIAGMRLRIDEMAARPTADVGVLSELRSGIDDLSSIQDRLGELSAVVPMLGELAARPAPRLDVDLSPLEARLDALAKAAAEERPPAVSASELAAAVAELRAAIEAARPEPTAASDGDDDLTAAVALLQVTLDRRLDELAAAGSGDVVADAIEALQASVVEKLSAIERRFVEVPQASRPTSPAAATGPASADVSKLEDLVRRETELLTQRVAALAVGVEATRALVEQQQVDAENRIGRKAGEVTRRLAADFGIRAKRGPGNGGRRDPRELGP